MRLRRASTLLAYWRDGQLLFDNYATRQTISANISALGILDFFHDWQTLEAAVDHFSEYAPRSVLLAIQHLLTHGLLLVDDSPEAARDSLIATEWSSWLPEGSFHFATKDAAYVRGNLDVEQRKATLPGTPPPNPFKSIEGAAKVPLPVCPLPASDFLTTLKARKTHRRFSRQDLSLEHVSQLLSLVWGVTGYLDSPIFGKLPRKTSPSGGARHPIEVYLMALRVENLEPGLYHYHPAQHHLETIRVGATSEQASAYCANQPYVKDAAALFLMTAVFPRTMWKYHKPRAYRVVTLDAGHVCQTFCLVATWLGLAPFSTAALKDTLIEEDLGIDGVCESVLYVAGVGHPVDEAAPASPTRAPDRAMADTDTRAFLSLVSGRRGHFRLESGHHGALWLDLNPLFAEPRRIAPFVEVLAEALRPHDITVVCGPLLGGAFLAQLIAHALDTEFCFTEREPSPDATGLYRARYRLPAALCPRVRGRRVAMVDDVMSAGSALRGTHDALRAAGAEPVVAGALLVLGTAGADYFQQRGVALVAGARDDYPLWTPDACPLCATGIPLEVAGAPAA